ncbi:MAG TPA: rod shape-determining protein MreC [Candidatus Polarisedimenticolia bacterium]|jgi:rod shape-determining protein MreC|nr:rod shape-determining protein MreC [Candidatus Polarisedimenticolia bacterium]
MPPRALTERKPSFLLVLLLALNLILMAASVRGGRGGSLLEDILLTIASPFLRAASAVSGGVASAWNRYADLRGVEEENRRLRARVGTLTLEAREAEEARQESKRLRDLLDLRDTTTPRAVAARVVARGGAGSARVLVLDRGRNDGLSRDQAVVTPRGAVGRVIEAAPGLAKVLSLLDPNSGVAALVQRTRVQGVLVGEGEETCRLEFVGENAPVEVGDVVVTSGLDEIFPKGVMLGVVSEVGEAQGLTRYVQVRPEVDVRRLEEVLVLAGAPRSDAGHAPAAPAEPEPAPAAPSAGKPAASPAEAGVRP